MANPKGNPQNLKSYKPKWKSGKTQTFRYPIAIANNLDEAARELDRNGNVSLLQVIESLKNNLNEAANKKPGKSNSLLLSQVEEKDKIILELESKLLAVTSERDELLSKQPSTVTGELIQAFKEAITIPSNRGGQIKKAIAEIGELIGLDVQKTGKGWAITDTSEK